MGKHQRPLTKESFERSGTTIAAWAADKGFSPALVYAVLAGRKRCVRGESHRIAIALGMKQEGPLR